jgi:hypothetical protein
MSDNKSFLGGIAKKLSVLMGGAIMVTGAQASVTPASITHTDVSSHTVKAIDAYKPLPAKLTLKQQKSGFALIAQHSSHSSHSSHHSHHSHSSHSSRAA